MSEQYVDNPAAVSVSDNHSNSTSPSYIQSIKDFFGNNGDEESRYEHSHDRIDDIIPISDNQKESSRKEGGQKKTVGISDANIVIQPDDNENPKVKTNPYRLCSAYAGYRIIRLSMELFIVAHTLKGDYSISMAGTFFLVYSICDMVSGSIYLWYPELFLGSCSKALSFFFIAVGAQIIGYTFFFVSHNLFLMVLSIAMCGTGTSLWYVNYQTVIQFSFETDDDLKKAASIRQIFEAIGFLLPSMSLAVIHFILPDNEQVFSITAFINATFALALYFASFTDVVNIATKTITVNSQVELPRHKSMEIGVWKSIKLLLNSSILRYFFLNSVVRAMSNIIGGTMAIITTEYFGLKETNLWIGAVGVPIGGILSAAKALLLKPMDEGLRFYFSSFCLVLVNIFLFGFAGSAIDYFQNHSTAARACLFLFGTIEAYFFSEIWNVAIACWLRELGQFSPAVVSRANSFHSIGVQLILAIVFQLQTVSLDAIEEAVVEDTMKKFLLASALMGTPALLTMMCLYLYVTRATLVDLSHFDWPMVFSMKPVIVKLIALLTKSSIDSMLYAEFSTWRTKDMVDAIDDDALTDGGALTPSSCTLRYSYFIHFLNELKEKYKEDSEDTFYTNDEVVIKKTIFTNSDAFEMRMNFLERAKSSIVLLTWSLDGDMTIKMIKRLIRKRHHGVNVKIMIDGVNFYYRCLLLNTTEGGTNTLMALKMLTEEGIDVKFLTEDAVLDAQYKCGSHRKIILIDQKYIIAGGRNTEDAYFKDEGTFKDHDVVLEGDFTNSVAKMLDSLWESGKDVLDIIGDSRYLDDMYDDMEPFSSFMDPFVSSRRLGLSSRRLHGEILNTETRIDEDDMIEGINASLISINHVTGRTHGIDMIYSTLLKLIECATNDITLVYGYFMLYPHLEEALSSAIKKGVKVRLFTNSSETNDLWFYVPLFVKGQERLLEMGAEVYVLNPETNKKGEEGFHCDHYKYAVIDDRAVMCGSWNCMGSSLFFDSEFAMLLFDDEERNGDLCVLFKDNVERLFEMGLYTKIEEAPSVNKPSPFIRMVMSKQAVTVTKRGY